MRCATCPKPGSDRCLGERLAHLCAKPEYRGYLETADPAPRPMSEPPADAIPHAKLRRAVADCPHRGEVIACSCADKAHVCGLGKGSPVPGTQAKGVFFGDCYRCVSTPSDGDRQNMA